MKNKLKLMISKKIADQSHFGSNIESLFYVHGKKSESEREPKGLANKFWVWAQVLRWNKIWA